MDGVCQSTGEALTVIGLSGGIAVGKTSILNKIIELDPSCHPANFSETLKSAVYLIWGVRSKDDVVTIFNDDEPRHATGRFLLQHLGQRVRQIDEQAWIQPILRLAERYENLVIGDVRYLNEVEAIEGIGGIVVRIHVDRKVQLERFRKLYPDASLNVLKHVSEVALNKHNFKYCLDTTHLTVDEAAKQIVAMAGSRPE